jgi:hypothetical protein
MSVLFSRRLCLFWAIILVAFIFVAPFRVARAQSDDEEPVDCPYIHFVQKGETLGIIAILYGIPVQEILDANNLFSPYDLVEWQPICIPRIAFERAFPEASFNARVFFNKLTIWGLNFPEYTQYNVKIRTRGADNWTFLGFLFISNTDEFQAYYLLPPDLSNETYFQVCLKEQDEDYLVCTTVDTLNVSGKRYKWNGTWITIPLR